jgi:hypothetical protein
MCGIPMDNATTQQQQPDLEEVAKIMSFGFDSILYTDSDDYRIHYTNKIIYYVLEVVSENSNITINQVCSLLRRTLKIPEDLTRSIVCSLLQSEIRVLKTYESAKDIKHLTLIVSASVALQEQLTEKYPILLDYTAPIYHAPKEKYGQKKKATFINGIVTEPKEVNKTERSGTSE